jgi:DNA invertase Pin-like site-specific DNA recombinase
VFGALAEFERDIIQERTKAGLVAARARGRAGGRPRALAPRKIAQLQALAADRSTAITDILDTLKISRSTYYRYSKIPTADS